MFRVVVLGGAMLCLALSGCIGEEIDGRQTTLPGASAAFTLMGKESAGEALVVAGKRLQGEPSGITNSYPPFMQQPPTPPCDTTNCEVVPLSLHDTTGKVLMIGVEWEGQDETWDTTGGPGYYLGDAAVRLDAVLMREGQVVLDLVETFHYGGAGILDDPESGAYEIQTVAVRGTSSYLLSVQLLDAPVDPADATPTELLPDLVAIPPDHPTFAVPIGHEAGNPGGVRVAGCGPDEVVEDQDVRCLRFAGIIGNQGVGDFLTVLEFVDAERTMVGGEGDWKQVIRATDGSEREVPIGAADYHEVHGHFHILDFVATQLYTYDLDTDTRGEPAGPGRKMGFCVIDGGIIDLLGPVAPPQYDGAGCCYIVGICQIDRLTGERFQMGMSPNWYDIYPWWRSDQYVEVSGLQDGIYELVSVINPDGLIVESDPSNNEASTVLRITGDEVEVLSMRTQATLGPHPDADWGYASQQQADDS